MHCGITGTEYCDLAVYNPKLDEMEIIRIPFCNQMWTKMIENFSEFNRKYLNEGA
jgi:hypothetical protein